MTTTKRGKTMELLRANKAAICFAMIINLLLLIPAALSAIFRQVFTDSILLGGVREWLPTLVMLMLGVGLFSAVLTWLRQICLVKLANKIELSRKSVYTWRLLHAPLSFFMGKNRYALLSEADVARKASAILTRDVLSLLFDIINVFFYLAMMLRVDTLMTAVVVALVVLNYALSLAQVAIRERIQKKLARRESTFGGEEHQSKQLGTAGLRNMESIKANALEHAFFQRVMGTKIKQVSARHEREYEEAYSPLESLPEILFMNALLLISALRIMDQSFSIGTYLAFQAYAGAFFSPLDKVLRIRDSFRGYEKRLESVSRSLDIPAAPEPQANERHDAKLAGYIRMEDVSFSYDGQHMALQNFSLTARPGSRIAIVGRSGAGKSTVLKLLQGLYAPTSGSIYLDGVPRERIDKQLFCRSVGCANQELSFFSASFRENIALWDPGVTDAEIHRAAIDVALHGYITSLHGAYEYKLMEDAKNLSAGQRERLELARAFLYQPTILLLDEAIGSLDPAAAEHIEEAIWRRGCTCISVTHVVSHLKEYDEIIVLDEGRIIARGNHDALLRTSAYYAALCQLEGGVCA